MLCEYRASSSYEYTLQYFSILPCFFRYTFNSLSAMNKPIPPLLPPDAPSVINWDEAEMPFQK